MNRRSATHTQKAGLTPIVGITVVSGDKIVRIPPSRLSVKNVGHKAYGIASIPNTWSTPFFVIRGRSGPSNRAIQDCLEKHNLSSFAELLIRSSGTDESILERGSNESSPCPPSKVLQTLAELEHNLAPSIEMHGGVVHWIVQAKIRTSAKGHLSNERRVSRVTRDWLAEIEQTTNQPYESHSIAIRPWRDPRTPEPSILSCPYKANYTDCLEKVARWAYSKGIRVHFEWVWDGTRVFIVQADLSLDQQGGVDPRHVVANPKRNSDPASLHRFHQATSSDLNSLPKLKNTQIYNSIGYRFHDFFILSDQSELENLIKGGVISDELDSDLKNLVRNPLILRTDGTDIPDKNRQMLPRSDELRSLPDARDWLLEDFAPKISELDLSDCSLSLVAHNFIPATASAWCKADPDKRRVRIESLWGIPEGLYWYTHDTYDVDTLSQDLRPQRPSAPFDIHKRIRYKSKFIAPDKSGSWVLHKTSAGPDWTDSIKRREWIEEISWSSRLIAQEAGYPVVVMWFIDVPKAASDHAVLPWYHERWHWLGPAVKAAPRKKPSFNAEFALSTEDDWNKLKALCDEGAPTISRVKVSPSDANLIRDQKFVSELGSLAKEYRFVIQLEGGILSHAYYLLTKEGCAVECSDLYAVEDEQLEFNKLVRDQIPNLITTKGENVEVVRLTGEALLESLKRKVVEESFELLRAKNTDDVQDELADIFEVIKALEMRLGVQKRDIEKRRRKKHSSRGGFEAGLMLKRTSLQPPISPTQRNDSFELELPLGAAHEEIHRIKDLPSERSEVNRDTRTDESGRKQRQLTVDIPFFDSQRRDVHIGEIPGPQCTHVVEARLDVKGMFIRLRINISQAPQQENLDL